MARQDPHLAQTVCDESERVIMPCMMNNLHVRHALIQTTLLSGDITSFILVIIVNPER